MAEFLTCKHVTEDDMEVLESIHDPEEIKRFR